jgi:hypothetical protein
MKSATLPFLDPTFTESYKETAITNTETSVASANATATARYMVPIDRSYAPESSSLLTNGRGLTNGMLMYNGNFRVEGYCRLISGRISNTTELNIKG